MDLRSRLINEKVVVDGKIRNVLRWNPDLNEAILNEFENKFYRKATNSSEAVHVFYHEIEPPLCYCGKETKFRGFYEGYLKFCSSQCAANDPDVRNKTKLTNQERFGANAPLACDEVKKKFKQTSLEKYGGYFVQTSEFKQKAKITNNEKYGVDSPMMSPDVRSKVNRSPESYKLASSKAKKTSMERYGVEYPILHPDVKEKAINTNLQKYGCANPIQNNSVIEKVKRTKKNLDYDSINEKRRKTSQERYGSDHYVETDEFKKKSADTCFKKYGGPPLRHPDVQMKARETNISRYGADHHTRKYIPQVSLDILNNKALLEEFLRDNSLSSAANILGVDPTTIGKACSDFDIHVPVSSYETEIKKFLTENHLQYASNKKTIIPPYQLDFYLTDHNLAIEFNGLYWHSEKMLESRGQNGKRYHLNKYKECEKRGIRLIHINEDEWIERSDVIKSKILNLCGLSERGVGARKLSVHRIKNGLAHDFCDKFHIQGKTGTAIHSFGAFDNDILVAVIQFSKQRTTQDLELIRFCTDGRVFAGLFSKLFKHAVSEIDPIKVISFADLRYSLGDVYEKNGFTKVKNILPDYSYMKQNRTYHKRSFTKAMIAKKFGITDLTEKDAMEKMGYHRIYDCGKIKYEWVNPRHKH